MEVQEMFRRLDAIIEASKVGILTTVDERGYPRSRWMTPVLVRGREGCVYAVTSPTFRKAVEIAGHPEVEWVFQTKTLDAVLTLVGRVALIDNPSLKSEVEEALGRNLLIFWRVNPDESNLVVLETVIQEMDLFLPMKNERYKVVV